MANSVLFVGLKHHFLITGFLTLLGLFFDFEQISFGTSIQVSLAASLGKSFVTNLKDLIGAISHSSTGLSTRMDLGSSLHVTGPSLIPQPVGAHISLGVLSQPMRGEDFFTFLLSTVQTSLGHLSHFSSITVWQTATSSSTSRLWCLVQHSDSYTV